MTSSDVMVEQYSWVKKGIPIVVLLDFLGQGFGSCVFRSWQTFPTPAGYRRPSGSIPIFHHGWVVLSPWPLGMTRMVDGATFFVPRES